MSARSHGPDGTPPPETMIREDCISPNSNDNDNDTDCGVQALSLGWANSWDIGGVDSTPAIVTTCREKNHRLAYRNLDPSGRGYDLLVWCDRCGYEYHIDSSD